MSDKSTEQRLKELETVIEYLVPASKNVNKALDSFADELQTHSENYTSALGEMSDIKKKIFLHFWNTAANTVEDTSDYQKAEGMESIHNTAAPPNMSEYFDEMAKEMGCHPDDIEGKMFFKDEESYQKFHMAFQLLSGLNSMLDPGELFDFVTYID